MPNKAYKRNQGYKNPQNLPTPPKNNLLGNNASGFNPQYPGKAGTSATPFEANGAEFIGDPNFENGLGNPNFEGGMPDDQRYSDGNGMQFQLDNP